MSVFDKAAYWARRKIGIRGQENDAPTIKVISFTTTNRKQQRYFRNSPSDPKYTKSGIHLSVEEQYRQRKAKAAKVKKREAVAKYHSEQRKLVNKEK